jgi:hypothetical protein
MSFTLRPNNTGASIGEEQEPAPATPAPATFKVTEIGDTPYRKGVLRTKFVPVTMKATTAIIYKREESGRQKHGNVLIEKYCAEFSAGDFITIDFPANKFPEVPSVGKIFVGKELSAIQLRAKGYLEPYFEPCGSKLHGPFAKVAQGGDNS